MKHSSNKKANSSPGSLLAALAVLLTTLWILRWWLAYILLYLYRPRSKQAGHTPPLDYGIPSAWFSLPQTALNQRKAADGPDSVEAVVFFIHPTTFFSHKHWNQPLTAMTRNHPLEQRLLPSQAGVFGDRFQLFIPKYPQANLAVFAMPDPLAREVLEIATGELLRAFDHFLEELGQRPFILAGHSQGAYHAVAILARRIAGTPLQNQLVAVYAPGYFIPAATFTEIGIPLCTDQAGTGCVQLWNAVSDKHRLPPGIHNMPQPVGPRPLQRKNPSFACTNPLDPSRDYVPAAENKGARVGNIFGLQEQMRSGLVGARCIEGKLIIDRPSRLRYRWAQMAPGWFHLYEFSYFFANIRADAHRRLEAWQRRQNS